jgi:cytochrome c nitrite reductase small subunit
MRKPLLFGLVGGAILLTGAVLFGPGAIKAVGAEPASCGACHVMENKVHSFQASDSLHKTEISCSDCHLPAGMEGLVEKYKVGMRHVKVNMQGAPEEIHLKATDRQWIIDNCVRCHATSEHIQEVGQEACLTCHATNPHGDKGTNP